MSNKSLYDFQIIAFGLDSIPIVEKLANSRHFAFAMICCDSRLEPRRDAVITFNGSIQWVTDPRLFDLMLELDSHLREDLKTIVVTTYPTTSTMLRENLPPIYSVFEVKYMFLIKVHERDEFEVIEESGFGQSLDYLPIVPIKLWHEDSNKESEMIANQILIFINE